MSNWSDGKANISQNSDQVRVNQNASNKTKPSFSALSRGRSGQSVVTLIVKLNEATLVLTEFRSCRNFVDASLQSSNFAISFALKHEIMLITGNHFQRCNNGTRSSRQRSTELIKQNSWKRFSKCWSIISVTSRRLMFCSFSRFDWNCCSISFKCSWNTQTKFWHHPLNKYILSKIMKTWQPSDNLDLHSKCKGSVPG